MRSSSSMDEFSRAFIGRVRAVAKTHAALAASKWEGARLRDLVALTLESYSLAPLKGEPRVRVHVSGEQIQVSPKAAAVICMTINELVTNAAKYGAFSNPTGAVDVSWDRRPGPDGESILRLQWVESGGPPVVPPARRGLGTQLIEEGVAYELGGQVHIEYRPEGRSSARLEFPLNDQNTRRSPLRASRRRRRTQSEYVMNMPENIAANVRRVLRILVVEDSFMTARAITRLLEEFGAQVLGPVPSVKRAMALLDQGQCDAAVLDINLGNETVEPVAERLEHTGLPYFFVSGYASPKSMLQDPRYKKHRLLPKPVEPTVFHQIVAEEFGAI